jgi:hypothetical protein
MSSPETGQILVALIGFGVGLYLLVRLAIGREVISSRWRTVQLSPLLTRLASVMAALTVFAIAVLLLPTNPLSGPASIVAAGAPGIGLLLLILSAWPATKSWGGRGG